MGGPMHTYGHVSFLCTDQAKAEEISAYFGKTVAVAMNLCWWPWYGDDGELVGDAFEPVPDPANPSTRMAIVFAGEHPTDERDLSFAAEMLNEKFPGIDAVYEMEGSEW